MGAITELIDIDLLLNARHNGLGAFSDVGGGLSGIASAALAVGAVVGTALLGAAVVATKWASDFQRDLTLIQTQANDTKDSLSGISSALEQMSTEVGFGPDQLAQSMYHVASAGFTGKQAIDMVRMAAELAQIGQADLESTTQAVIGSLSAFGDTGLTASEAVSILNATVGAGDMRMQGLTSAMSTGILPAARVAGLSLLDVGAAMATLTDNATPPEEAATRLRMTFSMLGAPTSAATKALEKIGLSASTLSDDMRKPNGLLVAITDLRSHILNTYGTLDSFGAKDLIARAFGGGRSSGAIETLLVEFGKFQSKYADISAGAHSFAADWQKTQQTTAFQWQQMQADVQDFGTAAGAILLPLGTKAMGAILPPLQHLAIWMSGPGQQSFSVLSGAIGGVMHWLDSLAAGFKEVTQPGNACIQMVHGSTDAFNKGAAIGRIWGDVVKAFGPILKDAQKFVGDFMKEHQKDFAEIQATVTQVMDAIEPLIEAALGAITEFWHSYGSEILAVVDRVFGLIVDIVKIAMHLLLDIIHIVTDILRGNWKQLWADVIHLLTDAVGGIFNLLGDLVQLVWAAFRLLLSGLGNILGDIMQAIVGIFKDIWDALVGHSIVPDMINAIIAWFQKLPGELVGILSGMATSLLNEAISIGSSIMKGIASGVTNGVGALKDAVSNAAGDALKSAKKLLGISSPSKVFEEEVGKQSVAGWAQGITNNAHLVGNALGGVASLGLGGGSLGLAGAGGGGATVVIDLRGSQVMSDRDMQLLAQKLMPAVGQALVRAGVKIRN